MFRELWLRWLLRKLASNDLQKRADAASELGRLGDSRAVGELIRVLDTIDSPRSAFDIYAVATVKIAAIRTLAHLGDQRAVDPIIRMLSSGDRLVRETAACALGWLADPKAVVPLMELWREARQGREKSSSSELAIVGSVLGVLNDPPGRDLLIDALNDPDESVRCIAADSLGKTCNADVVSALLDALKDKPVCDNAVLALGWIGDSRALDPLITIMRTNESQMSRKSAVTAIGMLGNPNAIDSLVDALSSDPDDSVRWRAIEAIVAIGDMKALPELSKAQSDSSEVVRRLAREALGKLKRAANSEESQHICELRRRYASAINPEEKSKLSTQLSSACEQFRRRQVATLFPSTFDSAHDLPMFPKTGNAVASAQQTFA